MLFSHTNSTRSPLALLATAGLVLLLAACGNAADDDDDECGADTDCKGDRICEAGSCVDPDDSGGGDDTNDDNNDDSNNDGSTEAYCCLNGEYYDCPDDDAVSTCSLDGPGDCSRDSSQDAECDDDSGGGDDGDDNTGGSDVGDSCNSNSECNNNICVVTDGTDRVGYCSKQCDSFSDCPDFWDCEEIDGATGTYCVDNS